MKTPCQVLLTSRWTKWAVGAGVLVKVGLQVCGVGGYGASEKLMCTTTREHRCRQTLIAKARCRLLQ